jgi:hypothetical protein
MDATVENGNVMNVVDPVEGDVDFVSGLIQNYTDANYTCEDLLADAYDSCFWSMVQEQMIIV